MNLALFLGAGFSAPFGHPVMNAFLGHADASKRISDDERAFLGKIILEARRANSFMESSPTNLEDILTFSEMGERLGLTKEGAGNRGEQLKEILRKIYTDPGSLQNYWDRYKVIETVLRHKLVEIKDNLSIITTNYDLNVESTCVALRLPVDPGFEIVRVKPPVSSIEQQYYIKGGVRVYKLHGSVNWYVSGSPPGVLVDDSIVPVTSSFDDPKHRTLPYPCTGDCKVLGAPIFIPPSFLKPNLSQVMKTVWAGAAKALSTAHILIFIGYSFPESDTEMMYFLARALMENSNLRRIYIVDTSAKEIVTRLSLPEGKFGSHFRALLEPIHVPQSWTDARLPI